jgi:hypothetical protein
MLHKTLLAEQCQDLEKRLISFKSRGILPASAAHQQFGFVLPSSECLLNPAVCFNYFDLSKRSVHAAKDAAITQSIDILTHNETHGFVNMGLERHNFIECSNTREFKEQVTERLFCNVIFLFDPIDIIEEKSSASIKRKVSLSECVMEIMSVQQISSARFQAIIVPEGLETIVSKIFPKLPIYIAPLKKGNLTLSSFTLDTSICSKSKEKTLWDIVIPDYAFAMQKYFACNPWVTKFGTHLTRFATKACLDKPFEMPSGAERERRAHETHKRILLSAFDEPARPSSFSVISSASDSKRIAPPESFLTGSEPGSGRASLAVFFRSKIISPSYQQEFSKEVEKQIRDQELIEYKRQA